MLNRTLMRATLNELHIYVFNIPASGKLNVLIPAGILPLALQCRSSKLHEMVSDLQGGNAAREQ